MGVSEVAVKEYVCDVCVTRELGRQLPMWWRAYRIEKPNKYGAAHVKKLLLCKKCNHDLTKDIVRPFWAEDIKIDSEVT